MMIPDSGIVAFGKASDADEMKLLEGRRLHIGIAGPCSPRAFAGHLSLPEDQLPEGLGGTPVNHLVRAFLELGHQVTVATLDRSVRPGDLMHFYGPHVEFFIGPYRARRRARDRFAVERRAIRDSLSQAVPAVVSAHWTYEFALGAIESGLPTLVTVHDVPAEVFRHEPTPYRLVRWGMHRQVMSRAACVAFNSEYTRTRLRSPRWSTAPVLPNTLPDSMWQIEPREPPIPERPVFVSVNNGFGRLKNVGALIQAFVKVRDHVPGARLILIGDGFEPDGPAPAWACTMRANVGVEYFGPLQYEATIAAVRAADVLVHPSLEESFGYTLIEAASVGTPVIAGESSGAVPWVLGGGAQGVLVDVSSPDAIASVMIALVRDPVRWSELRARAFEVGKERFSATAVAREYIRLLGGLANARTTRAR